jgi:hypothetical protein
MSREVLVCIAQLVWPKPCRGEKYWYCIDDGQYRSLSNMECTTIKELAEELLLSGPLSPQDKIIYKPPVDEEMTYADGYFGRRAVAAEGYLYKPLKRKQIKQLENHLARLRRAGKPIMGNEESSI